MVPRFLYALLALMLVSTVPARAQSIDDQGLTAAVAQSVTTYTRFTIFDDVSVLVEGGSVTLRGKVTMPFKRDDIGRRVERLAGVRSVSNEIEVLPVSIYDDQLRKKIARAIYGNSAFWRYAAMANPPIHIVVEHGRVTLTGIVPTEVDRMLAQSLATGKGELSVVNELRTELTRGQARPGPGPSSPSTKSGGRAL